MDTNRRTVWTVRPLTALHQTPPGFFGFVCTCPDTTPDLKNTIGDWTQCKHRRPTPDGSTRGVPNHTRALLSFPALVSSAAQLQNVVYPGEGGHECWKAQGRKAQKDDMLHLRPCDPLCNGVTNLSMDTTLQAGTEGDPKLN